MAASLRSIRSGGTGEPSLDLQRKPSPKVPSNSTSAFRAPLRKFEHKARRRRMRKQPILSIGDARLGGTDAAAGVEHPALAADHPPRLAHAAHQQDLEFHLAVPTAPLHPPP